MRLPTPPRLSRYLLLVAACGGNPSSSATDEASTAPTLTIAETGDTSEDASSASTTPGPKFDVGWMPDGGVMPRPEICAQIDILVVVDNSNSMSNEQDNLVASFPGFVKAIQQELDDAESLHIGVITTDSYNDNESPCDDVLGALVTRTGGTNSSDATCGPYESGLRFMTEKDQLIERFSCAAQVGTAGSTNERQLEAALEALGPELGAEGACNEQFLRTDALLVLVLISDEEDDNSDGDPPDWFDALVELKGGVETDVVVLSLIGPDSPECPHSAETAFRIVEFTKMFTYGRIGMICADDYQNFFHEMTGVIDQACHKIVPPE